MGDLTVDAIEVQSLNKETRIIMSFKATFFVHD